MKHIIQQSIFFMHGTFYTGLAVCLFMMAKGEEAHATGTVSELKVVDYVDLNRYLGKWYEIARIPVFFQKECAGGVTAEYALMKDGKISVVNQCCTEEGKVKQAKGRAWVVDKKTNAKLKVSFVPFLGLWLFAGDYWISDLGPQYEYAVIGNPSRSIGWILSRTPTLPDEVMKGIAERLKAQGYDFSRFKMTDQKNFTSCSE